MLKTYEAILDGNNLRWSGETPQAGGPIPVHVTLLVHEPKVAPGARGQAMAEALERLAAMNAFSEIEDPVAWQREIRKDRPLPGRD